MIAVIADDLTGAAEIAGISLRFGLKVKLLVNIVEEETADVLIVSTDSRSMREQNAIKENERVAEAIVDMKPTFVFKKIDSVMRGYILAETKALAEKMHLQEVIIVPANPSLNRTIKNGQYFIGDRHVTETGFANDPEFPASSNLVAHLLGDATTPVLRPSDYAPGNSMIIGEASSEIDVEMWAAAVGKQTLPVGAGDFFAAILRSRFSFSSQEEAKFLRPLIYVCGTAFDQRKQFINSLSKEQDIVLWLPATLTESWVRLAVFKLKTAQKLVLAINEAWSSAEQMRSDMATAVKEIVRHITVREIFIEGGSTATAVLAALNIQQLQPLQELSRGVVRMQANNYFITLKPGSYPLPAVIEEIFHTQILS